MSTLMIVMVGRRSGRFLVLDTIDTQGSDSWGMEYFSTSWSYCLKAVAGEF